MLLPAIYPMIVKNVIVAKINTRYVYVAKFIKIQIRSNANQRTQQKIKRNDD